MLILTRRPHQRIVIDGRIEVVVLEVAGDTVRLGITAPREVAVHRHEVLDAVRAANQEAMTGAERLSSGNAALRNALAPGGRD